MGFNVNWSLAHVLDTLAACPGCGGTLSQPKDDVIACQRCGDLFPVKHYIPIMYGQPLAKASNWRWTGMISQRRQGTELINLQP